MELFTSCVVACLLFNALGILVGIRWGYRLGTEDAEMNCGNAYAKRERERQTYVRN